MQLDANHKYDFEGELFHTKYVPVTRNDDLITLESDDTSGGSEMMPVITARIIPSGRSDNALLFDVSIEDFPDLLAENMDYPSYYKYWIKAWSKAADAAEILARAVVYPD